MGLTKSATGLSAAADRSVLRRQSPTDVTVALTGNPNVGKSTVFNELTGMHQHTGNWPGKTVTNASGVCRCRGRSLCLMDVPGVYSLSALSPEEMVARDFVCFGGADVTVVVCDATCLQRSIHLALQTLEVTPRAVLCVNLMDEAEKKGIRIDLEKLQQLLGVPVTGAAARRGRGMQELKEAILAVADHPPTFAYTVRYDRETENAVNALEMEVGNRLGGALCERWAALKLLEGDEKLICAMEEYTGASLSSLRRKAAQLCPGGREQMAQAEAAAMYRAAEDICRQAVTVQPTAGSRRQLQLDRLLTRRSTGIPLMLLLLAGIFYLTLEGANFLSDRLSGGLFRLLAWIAAGLQAAGCPGWLHSLLTEGILTVSLWVISVMLPPMAIFFPLFTLLEDLGYLPRVAFNLDNAFRRCRSCGKQSLTMCMGLGCNAAGVVGCRIIDSPRERLIAVLTNSLVPCNGRFPTIITMITIFFAAGASSGTPVPALLLTGLILLSVLVTFAVSWLLSHTLLRGLPSVLTLEIPPFRPPNAGRVILRSVFDRTLFVLGRAVSVAAPAGAVLWIFTHLQPGGVTLLDTVSRALHPLAAVIGLDGVILTAFILGLPANEIILPIMIMAYSSGSVLTAVGDPASVGLLLAGHGWTPVTALCFLLFFLFHWPCATTLLTIRKETGKWRWTALAAVLPTAVGALLAAAVHFLSLLF